MTQPTIDGDGAPTPPPLPPNPAAYDHPRARRAREKGLPTPYIPGGEDPNAAATEAGERRLVRILVIFALVIVFSGFVFGIISLLLSGPGR